MAFLRYFLLRAVLFVFFFVLFLYLQIGVVLSSVYAIAIAFALNFLFFQRQRDAAAGEVRDVFTGEKKAQGQAEIADAAAEDAAVDALTASVQEPETPYESSAATDIDDAVRTVAPRMPLADDSQVSGPHEQTDRREPGGSGAQS